MYLEIVFAGSNYQNYYDSSGKYITAMDTRLQQKGENITSQHVKIFPEMLPKEI